MIRITIELLPQGKEELKRCLGVAVITNDYVKSLLSQGDRGDYNVKLSKFGGKGLWKKGRVEGFDRKNRGPWDLLFIALRNLVGDRNKERKCRVCGCTDDDCSQCIKAQGKPCHWVKEDLCSRCENEGGK